MKTSEVFKDSLPRMACVLFWKQADGSADLLESCLALPPTPFHKEQKLKTRCLDSRWSDWWSDLATYGT